MTVSGETQFTIHSKTIVKRLKLLTGLNADGKAAVEAFIKVDTKLQQLAEHEGKTEAAENAVMIEVGECDVARDTLLPELALALATAKLGPRVNPFKPFSKFSPALMSRLPFAEETKAIVDLCANVTKAKPPAPVKAIVKSLLKENARVHVALDRLDGPTTAHEEALFARNQFMPQWHKALSNLRVQMKAALASRPGAYEALFRNE